MAVLLADAAQAAGAKDITVRELAGLEPISPNGGTRAAARPLSRRSRASAKASQATPTPETTPVLAQASGF